MKRLDWDADNWGGHVHLASSGSWLEAEGGEDA